MESQEDDKITNILEIIKEYRGNNEFFKDNKLEDDTFKKLNEKNDIDNKKKYLRFTYNKIYIANKKPLADLMNILHFNEIEKSFNDEKEDDENESIKNKIKEHIKNNPSINFDDYINKLEFYDSEEKIEEVISKNIDIIFIREEFLTALRVRYNNYKNKHIFFALKKEFIFFYIPKTFSSFMINLNLISGKIPQLNITKKIKNQSNTENKDKVKESQFTNQINHKPDDENKINEDSQSQINQNSEIKRVSEIDSSQNNNKIINLNENNIDDENETREKLNNNISIVIYHLNFIYSFDQIQSMYVKDLNNINEINNLLFNNNINNQLNYILNCFLVDSEIFEKFEEDVYYEECENIYNTENMNEKDTKIRELFDKLKKDKKTINKISIINDYQECMDLMNKKNNIQFTFVNEKICEEIGLDKNIYAKCNICLFKINDELFVCFRDEQKIMKVFNMKKYYKLSINIENIIDVPKNIVNELVSLYEQEKNINDLIDNEIKENSFRNYYIVNKNWLKEFKIFYNFEEIVIKYEEQSYDNENEENSQNNNGINNNNQIYGMNKKKRKNKKKRRRKNQNNNRQNIINNSIKKTDNKFDIKVQYTNVEHPKSLLNENNILPKYNNFNTYPYPIDFELVEISTLKNLCDILKLKISNEILNKICFKAILGDRKLFLQRESSDNVFAVFTSRGDQNILEYLIIYDNKNIIKEEFNIIKRKGIDKYLSDMFLNFNDDKLQYLIDQNHTTTIGKIYIVNKKGISSNNLNYNNINNINLNNNIIIINNNYSFSRIDQISPYRLGLDNIGATCYMNATLQCLCNVGQLQNFFLNNEQIYQNKEIILAKAFGEVMQNLYDFNKNKKSYQPNNFKEVISVMNPLFKGIAANDSKDLILFLYEKMHEELKIEVNYNNFAQNISPDLLIFREEYYSKNTSIIVKTFYYEMQSINQCLNCQNKVISYNIQNIIIFPLEKIRQSLMKEYPTGFPFVHLDECFKENEKAEKLSGLNRMYCNNCKTNSEAYTSNKYTTCPEVMTIILNRGKGIEFEVEFNFPLRIDINNYVVHKDKSTIYDLIGVLVHTGGSDMSGHFFAICKSNIDHKWYLYNDSIVQMLSENYEYEIKNSGLPYVLFYQNLDCLYNNENHIQLYFRTTNNEIYLDVNYDELFGNVIQRLSMKYSNCSFNLLNANYYVETVNGNQLLDYNKTVKQNNLSIYSYIFIDLNK